MEYRVLGPMTVTDEGSTCALGGPRQQLVLAALVIDAGRGVSTDRVVRTVWGDDPPQTARQTIQSYVSRLRQAIGSDAIERHGEGYLLVADGDDVDAIRFERLVAEGRRLVRVDPATAGHILRRALGLWFGPAYDGLDASGVVRTEAARLDELRMTAVEARIDADLGVGAHADVAVELASLVREHPLRERLRAQQMLALYGCGRQAEALQAYGRARDHLADELGLDPSSELRDLEQRILEQDPTLPMATRPEAGVGTAPGAGTVAAAPGRTTSGADPSPVASVGAVRGYELRDRLGSGDFGVVHRAFQPSVGREVAVKVIRPEHANRPDFVRRFEHEAQLVAQLEHPHVVPLYDFWRDPTGAYLVMPLLRGGSLRTALGRGGWHLGPALRLLDQVGGALAHAHRHGVVHRDVKPANVLLDTDGNAYLSDFGIAVRDTDDADLPVTSSMAYVPPEELSGQVRGPAADVFGLGVLTWELLTGQSPPTVRPLPAASAARNDLPSSIDAVLERATHVDPARRHERVEAFLRELRQACGQDVVEVGTALVPDGSDIRNPYKGLRAFRETDAGDFFGRSALVEELVAAITDHPLVLVVGPSGSGKSSVVRAGLVPALRAGAVPGSRDWLVTDMFPGSHPFEELGAALLRVAVDPSPELLGELRDSTGLLRASKLALPDDDSTLLLVIDQFEELFSAVSSEETRRAFLANLVSVAGDSRSRVRVVATMRADFFDHPLRYGEFADAVAPAVVTVGPPTRDGLAQAIAGPAARVGLELEPGLVGRVTADVESQPGGLPLLQYALTELVAHREDGRLTIAGYERTGGVLGALGRRADELYDAMPAPTQEAARQVFLRLVTVGDGTADTRRRARRSELAALGIDQATVDDVLRQFGAYRLLSFDHDPVTRGPTVEVAHEALLHEWGRLRDWIEDHRDELVQQRRMAAAAAEWEGSGRDASYLLRGARLEEAIQWLEQARVAPTGEEVAFLETSVEQRRRELLEAAARRRRLVTGLVVVLALVSVLAAVAWVQRGRAGDNAQEAATAAAAAQEAEQRAEERALEARVRELANEALIAVDEDPQRALHLGLAALDLTDDGGGAARAEAVAATNAAMQASDLLAIEDVEEGRLVPAGDAVVVVGEGRATITDPAGERRTVVEFGPGSFEEVAATVDGSVVALLGLDADEAAARLVVLDTVGGSVLADLSPPGRPVRVAVSASGDRVATFSCLGECPAADTVTVHDVATGEVAGSWPIGAVSWEGAFLPGGELLLVTTAPPTLRVVDATSGDVLRERPVDGLGQYPRVVPSPDGASAVVLARGVATRLYRLDDLGLVATIATEGDDRAAWSPDGAAVATTGISGAVTIVDAETGAVRRRLLGADNNNFDISWTADDRILVDSAGRLLVFDASAAGPAARGSVAVTDGPVRSTDRRDDWAVHPIGGLGVPTPDGRSLQRPADVVAHAGSHGGSHVALLRDDGSAVVAVLPTLETVATAPTCREPVALSPDGRYLLAGWVPELDDGACAAAYAAIEAEDVDVVDTATGELVWRGGPQWTGAFAPASLPLVAISDQVSVQFVDTRTWSVVGVLTNEAVGGGFGFLFMHWDEAPELLAIGASDGRVFVVDGAAVLAGEAPTDAIVFDRTTHAGAVPWVDVDAASDTVASLGIDGRLRLFGLATGEFRVEAPIAGDGLAAIAIEDGGRSVLHRRGGPVDRFVLDPDELVDIATSLLVRELTPDECETHALDPCPVRLG